MTSPTPLKSVLVIDDDPLTGSLLQGALKGGFKVGTLHRGSGAIAEALAHRPDVILLDLHMPHVDGFEVLTQLKQHPETSRIPVFCMSGDSSAESRLRASSLGASGFVSKPIDVPTIRMDLESLVQSLSQKSSSFDGKRTLHLHQNVQELRRAIGEEILSSIHSSPVLVLGHDRGASWVKSMEQCLPEESARLLREALESERAMYLEILPSTLAKMPFLLDLSPWISDLQGFLRQSTTEYILMIEGPEKLLGSSDPSTPLLSQLTRVDLLKEGLGRHFLRTDFWTLHPSESATQALVRAMTDRWINR
jgi:CheY-like chemotaxis protein